MRPWGCTLHSSCLQPPAPAAPSSQHRKVPMGLEARDFAFLLWLPCYSALFGWHTRLCTTAASCGVLCSILECLQWYFEQLVTSPAWSYPNELLNCFLLVEYRAKSWKKVDTCRLYRPRPVSENLPELGPQDLPQPFLNRSYIDLNIVNFSCCFRKHASHKHHAAIQRNRGPIITSNATITKWHFP